MLERSTRRVYVLLRTSSVGKLPATKIPVTAATEPADQIPWFHVHETC